MRRNLKIMPQTSESPSQHILNPGQWVDQHGNYLYNFAIGRLRSHEDAENVVQETFLAALKAAPNFAGQSSERTWLTGILKHKIIDHMRKNYREKPVSALQGEDADTDQFFDQAGHLKAMPSGWLPEPDELLEKKEFWETFRHCKEKLPKTTHEAFTLREIEKLDSKNICSILNISTSNYWVLMHRARLQLRQCLEENWFAPPEGAK